MPPESGLVPAALCHAWTRKVAASTTLCSAPRKSGLLPAKRSHLSDPSLDRTWWVVNSRLNTSTVIPSPVTHSVGDLGSQPSSRTLCARNETGPACRPGAVGTWTSASHAGKMKRGRLGSMSHRFAQPRKMANWTWSLGSEKESGDTRAKIASGALLAALPPVTANTIHLRRCLGAPSVMPETSDPQRNCDLDNARAVAMRPDHPVGTLAMRLADCAASLTLTFCAASRRSAPIDSSTPKSLTTRATMVRGAPASSLRETRCAMPAANMVVLDRLTTMWLLSSAPMAARRPTTICLAALRLARLTNSVQLST